MSDAKIAVITGVSRGLGLALAREFAEHGWQVEGTGRSEQPADLPGGVTYHRFDAGDAVAGEAFWKQLHEKHPGAQICLVNNAGGYVSGGLTELKPEDYVAMIQSCYFSAVFMTRSMALVYAKARVVNVISSSALAPHKTNSAYGAAKAAEMHFFQSLQREFTPSQYRITNLYPDYIASWGPDVTAIAATDLAQFVREQAENTRTYYLRDVSLHATGR